MSTEPAKRNTLERYFSNVWVWLVIAGSVFAFNVIRAVTNEIPQPPRVLSQLPEFRLTNQDGQQFGSSELRGKFWVANFMFTSCPTICPKLTDHMQKVKHRLRGMGSAVHLVSFSVDPERDTPEVLRKYVNERLISVDKWSFLTGDLTTVKTAVVEGFKLPMEKEEGAEERTAFDITHGSRFVLVDPDHRIRGYYEMTGKELNRMMRDITIILADYKKKARVAVAQ